MSVNFISIICLIVHQKGVKKGFGIFIFIVIAFLMDNKHHVLSLFAFMIDEYGMFGLSKPSELVM